MKKFLTILYALVYMLNCSAKSTLSTGDIAFIGINSDGSDDFTFLLLTDIDSGTVLYITDQGWDDVSSSFYSVGGDATLTWKSTSDMSAGSEVNIATANPDGTVMDPDVASVGSLSGNTTIGSFGDQVFIYQGSAASPTFITGIHFNVEAGSTNGNWDGAVGSSGKTYLPDQLTNGVNAIWVHNSGTEQDDFRYKCSATTSGDAATLRAAINNVSNWDSHNTSAFTISPFPCSFSVSSPCSEPTIPTVTATSSTICDGASTTLNISGTLNDATAWHIYTGSCGGTSVGNTPGTTCSVSPSSATTYYVRGEGGCATPAGCGTVTISVNPIYDLTESKTVCSGNSYTFPDGTTQNNITSQVVHTSNLTTSEGCDSIIETTVNV
ncbi:MAG: hypothetical protein MI922_26035, partial [Bacteroidales bacterium]|nr:hypothetical protein [Bacteroidales bacterium]